MTSIFAKFKASNVARIGSAYILVGWIIYPLGYLAPVAGDFDAIREVLYTIADIINKVGLGVLVLGMARIKSGEKV